MVKSKVPINIQVALFIAHRSELFDGNRVKPRSNKVYEDLSQQIGMTPGAVHFSVIRNAKEILAAEDKEQEKLNDESLTESNKSFINQSTVSATPASSEKSLLSDESNVDETVSKFQITMLLVFQIC